MRWRGKALVAVVVVLTGALAGTLLRNAELDAGGFAFKTEDYPTALKKLRPLAYLGDSTAQYLLGLMYAYGWGVARNDEAAIGWFRRAGMWSEGTRDRAATAEYYVGREYAEGGVVPRDEAVSRKWFERAAKGGYRPDNARGDSEHNP
jgi:TPR repeat protein